ncbi:jg31, partial [Pararge aegeria aegeria]
MQVIPLFMAQLSNRAHVLVFATYPSRREPRDKT